MAEATQASGVLLLTADSGNTVVVTFTDSLNHTVTKTLTGAHAAHAVTLEASDLGSGTSQLQDGSITVKAVATNSVHVDSSAGVTSFFLDTVKPIFKSITLGSSNADSNSNPSIGLKPGDVLTLTAVFDESVQVKSGQTFTPTLTIGTETGIALVPGITTGNSRSWTYTINKTDGTAADSGAVLVNGLGSSFLAKLEDAAGNPVENPDSNKTTIDITYTVDSSAPSKPTLALGSGVSNGASQAEATSADGVILIKADAGNSVVLTFTDSSGDSVIRSIASATGSSQAITLASSELGTGTGQLEDGDIIVSAVSSNAALVSSATAVKVFTLDTVAPKLTGLTLTSSTPTATPPRPASRSSRVMC